MAETAVTVPGQADLSEYLISDPKRHERAMAKIREQFSEGETLKISSLSQISVPSGTAVQNKNVPPKWVMPDGSTQDRLHGIILYRERQRLFFKDPYGTAEPGPPDCWSPLNNGNGMGRASEEAKELYGHMGVGGECLNCKMKEFDTAINADGSIGGGKACNRRTTIYMLQPGKPLPVVVTLSELNYDNVRDFFLGTVNEGFYDEYEFVTELSLMRRESKRAGGIGYALAAMSFAGAIGQDALKTVRKEADFWVPMIENSIREREEASLRRAEEQKQLASGNAA